MEDQPRPWEGEGVTRSPLRTLGEQGCSDSEEVEGSLHEKVGDAGLSISENTMHGAGQHPLCKEE